MLFEIQLRYLHSNVLVFEKKNCGWETIFKRMINNIGIVNYCVYQHSIIDNSNIIGLVKINI